MDAVIHVLVHVPAVAPELVLVVVKEVAEAHARILAKTPVKVLAKELVAADVAA